MPTYDYRCEACGHRLELFQSITESPKKKCPDCKKLKLKRMIGAGAGFIFKGSGFYETDYRSESYKKGAEKEKAASEKAEKPKTDKSKPDKPKTGAKKKD
jgi:putative FmdB family regulatory protein